MDNQKPISIYDVWNESSEFISRKNISLDKTRIDDLIASIFSIGPFYFYIFDLGSRDIHYMSPPVREIHGLDPDLARLEDITDLIHPDDMGFVTKAEQAGFDLCFNRIGAERFLKYKYSYCFRMRVADGSYRLFNHQAVTVTTDENFNISQSLNVHTDISHLTTVNTYKASAIGMLGEPSYLNIDVLSESPALKNNNSIFSNRELEIIREISHGLTTDAIAEKLFISRETVKTHRKRILNKSGCRNVGQLITHCVVEGLL